MNKRKLAVFVEGQTELIFVREFLKQWYSYDASKIGFNCYNLLANEFRDAEYKYGSEESENYFMVVNVGNDNSVLSKNLENLNFIQNKGYQLVIGLRDMYCSQYKKDVKGQLISETVNQSFIQSVKDVLCNVPNGQYVDFHFAIMEIEAWFIAMHEYMLKLDEKLTPDFIKEHTGLDLDVDPETAIFHPANELAKIYSSVGKQYDKHQTDISSIMSKLTPDDFLLLISSGKCPSFKRFAESLIGNSCNM